MEERQLSLLKGPRQKGTLAPGPTERQIQISLVRMLKVGKDPGWMFSAFPAGELRTQETGELLKASGLKAGWPDLIFIGPDGQHYWMELKRKGGRLSEDQAAFALEMIKRQVPHAVAHSVEEAIAILKRWGAVKQTFHI